MIKSPFSSRSPKDFRILQLYPNVQMSSLMPQSIGIFSALFKNEGYTDAIFDCTYYQDVHFNDDDSISEVEIQNTNDVLVENRAVPNFNTEELLKKGGAPKKGSNIKHDFIRKVNEFKPDLILVSVVESTYFLAIDLLRSIPEKDRNYKTLLGGVFPTYAADKVIKNELVDYVCRGEGEEAILELCNKFITGGRIDDVKNFHIKADGQIFKNRIRAGMDLNTVPIPDWDLFDPGSLYRPMSGGVYRTVGVETQRGCPYTCTFCNSPGNNVIYKEETSKIFHRKKSIKRMKEEFDFLIKKYDPELIYFISDTFLAMSHKEFDEFKEMYSDYKIPFWMNTRAETINEHRANGLEEMNMLRCDIGIEHGNADYRKNYLRRNVSDDVQIKAFEMLADKTYTATANCIIGMPDETRELVFDTIEFTRKLPKSMEAAGAFIFAPYHGTPLRELAIKKGYITEDCIVSLGITGGDKSLLNMPHLPSEEIGGIAKTFAYYTKFPKERWNEIKIAEKFTPEGEDMHKKLGEEFDKTYRSKDAIDAVM
jgi:radical SAM superfamily enzyme YgiQ (UPF0313 family)